jgi:uncharacterized protein
MRASLILHVDPWQDAARGSRYEGHLSTDRLPRLSAVASLRVPVEVNISFHQRLGRTAKRGAIEIELEVRSRLDMMCQRCLEPLSIESALNCSVWVVRDEAAARLLESESMGDTIVSPPGERLVLATVVEDELLLALPFAPSHALGDCKSHFDEKRHVDWDHDVESLASGDDSLDAQRHEEERIRGVATASKASASDQARTKAPVHEGDLNRMPGHGDGKGDGGEAKRNPFAVLALLRGDTDEHS